MQPCHFDTLHTLGNTNLYRQLLVTWYRIPRIANGVRVTYKPASVQVSVKTSSLSLNRIIHCVCVHSDYTTLCPGLTCADSVCSLLCGPPQLPDSDTFSNFLCCQTLLGLTAGIFGGSHYIILCKSSKMEEEYEIVKKLRKKIGAQLGIEPRTFWLLVRCSYPWATGAPEQKSSRQALYSY